MSRGGRHAGAHMIRRANVLRDGKVGGSRLARAGTLDLGEVLMRWLVMLAVWTALGCGGDDDGPAPGTDAGGGIDAGALCGGDSDCDDGVFCNGEEQCEPADPAADGRGCLPGDAAAVCDTGFRCDEATAGCVVEDCSDADPDGDGVDSMACGGTDCDDADANRFPGNPEVCDAADVDEDCDATTFGDRDADGDGYVDAACCNGTTCGDDCDDSVALVHPAEAESCDGLDNDCDGSVDEMVQTTFYLDNDRDGHGQDGATMQACGPVGMYTATMGGDCDDTSGAANPGATEICDGMDNDCDGMTDEMVTVRYFLDADRDGYGVTGMSMDLCAPAGMYTATMDMDCDDANAARNPGRTEICDGLDNDCDASTWAVMEDDDGDDVPDTACGGTDCDDTDPTVYPGAPEPCNGVDNDCSGDTEDRDGDRYVAPTTACTGGPFPKTDCNDFNRDVNPGQRQYFGLPYCGPAQMLCGSSGSWTCRLLSCSGSTGAPPSFDYDCSGTAEPEPAFGSCGGLCLVAIPPSSLVGLCRERSRTGTCGDSGGPVYSGSPPACGTPLEYRACCCGNPSRCTVESVPAGDASVPIPSAGRMPCR